MPGFKQSPVTFSLRAAGNITKKRFVNYAATQATANQNTIGVADFGVTPGENAAVAHLGVATVTAGAVINGTETRLQTDAQGRAVPFTTGPVVARLFPGQTAIAAGDEIAVILIPN
jgi:hypothetical protein